MSKVYNLTCWKVVHPGNPDPFLAPEYRVACLAGLRDDGKMVITSKIMSSEKNVVKTYSGSTYILDDVDPEYYKWVIENNLNFDPEQPVKIKML